jgi:hypothetical protein
MKRFIYGVLASVSSLLMAAVPFAAAQTNTVVVSPGNLNGWKFIDDQNDSTLTATGSFVTGPATPPLGSGSAQLQVNNTTEGQALMKNAYGGQKLSNLQTLTYSTYVQNGNNTIAPSLQFSVDQDVTDNITSWQGRIVFEPYLNGTVTDNTWQNWNAQSGQWWLTRPAMFNNMCPQSSPCALTTLTSAFPNIGVNGGANQQILFKAGSGWNTPFIGNVDALTVGFTSGTTTTYDFELYPTPSNSNDCKNSGFQTMYDNSGMAFRNQGQCVSWVQHNVNGNGQPNNQGQVQGANTNTGGY